MSKLLIALLSFILGGGLGFLLMGCIIVGKESDKQSEKDFRKTKDD